MPIPVVPPSFPLWLRRGLGLLASTPPIPRRLADAPPR